MEWLKNIFARLIGKDMADGTTATSKAKLTAIIGVILVAIQTIPQAFGHAPIVIPEYVYKFLEFAGLWTLRDAIKAS